MHLIQLVSACLLAGLINPVIAFGGFHPRYFPYGGNYRNNRRPAPGPYPANTRTGSSGSGGYEGPTQNIFPFYLREIFAFKAHLATTQRTVASVESTLNDLKDTEIPDCLTDIENLINGVLSQYDNTEKCQFAVEGSNAFFTDSYLGKCYHYFAATTEAEETYAEAKQACLESHGRLAVPDLTDGSTFGYDLKDAATLTAGDFVWIDGAGDSGQWPRANGQDLAAHDRLMTGSTEADPGAAVVVVPVDANVVGDVVMPPPNIWDIKIEAPDATVVGYVCEYKITVFNDGL